MFYRKWIRNLKYLNSRLKSMDLFGRNCKISNCGVCNISKYISGRSNELIVGAGSVLDGVHIRIVGRNNRIAIGNNCFLGQGCSIWCEGNNIQVQVGDNCTFTHDTQLCAQENNVSIIIGSDCMFSHHVNVRTSDSHVIYNLETGERLNYPGSVKIADHVWFAPECKVFKGITIGKGSIVGTGAIVTKDIPEYSLAVGTPAKVVKKSVSWNREKLF